MLKNLAHYERPTELPSALRLLGARGKEARILAGGTAILKMGNPSVTTLVDIKGLKLDAIRANSREIRVGATVTIRELLDSAAIRKYCGGLVYQAAHGIGSTPLRNLITVAGNIVHVLPWSDLPLTLLVADAKVAVAGANGTRILSYRELMKKHPTVTLGPSTIVTEIILPVRPGYVGSFTKFARTTFDYALVDVAVVAKLKNGVFSDVEMGVSAAGPMPQRLVGAAEVLRGASSSDLSAIARAAEAAAAETRITRDMRVSVEYKRHVVGVLFQRMIAGLAKRKGKR